MKKKLFFLGCLLSVLFTQASEVEVKTAAPETFLEKLQEIFGDSTTAEEKDKMVSDRDRIMQVKFYLESVASKASDEKLDELLNHPTKAEGADNSLPLFTALSKYTNAELFGTLMFCGARVDIKTSFGTIEKLVSDYDPLFSNKIILEGNRKKLAEILLWVKCGMPSEKAAVMFKKLISEDVMTEDEVYNVLDHVAVEKEGEFDRFSELADALLDGEKYTKKDTKERVSDLRSKIRALEEQAEIQAEEYAKKRGPSGLIYLAGGVVIGCVLGFILKSMGDAAEVN